MDSLIEHVHSISIHKALTGLDLMLSGTAQIASYFNPQGPHGPRRRCPSLILNRQVFQSTRPSRASTIQLTLPLQVLLFQSTRPSRASTIQLTLPLQVLLFQSTRPSRASTITVETFISQNHISIHKALTGLDGSRFMITLMV